MAITPPLKSDDSSGMKLMVSSAPCHRYTLVFCLALTIVFCVFGALFFFLPNENSFRGLSSGLPSLPILPPLLSRLSSTVRFSSSVARRTLGLLHALSSISATRLASMCRRVFL